MSENRKRIQGLMIDRLMADAEVVRAVAHQAFEPVLDRLAGMVHPMLAEGGPLFVQAEGHARLPDGTAIRLRFTAEVVE